MCSRACRDFIVQRGQLQYCGQAPHSGYHYYSTLLYSQHIATTATNTNDTPDAVPIRRRCTEAMALLTCRSS